MLWMMTRNFILTGNKIVKWRSIVAPLYWILLSSSGQADFFRMFSRIIQNKMPNNGVHYFTTICQHTDLQFNISIVCLCVAVVLCGMRQRKIQIKTNKMKYPVPITNTNNLAIQIENKQQRD